MKHTDIAIVGAGVTGLAAASQLSANCFQIFEKSRGPGGRLASKRIEPLRADIGAQFFTVRDPIFRVCVERAIAYGFVSTWEPKLGTFRNEQPILSPDQQTRYVGTPYMNSFGRYLSKGIDLKSQSSVASVVQRGSKYCLTMANGDTYIADKVLITTPVNQMLDILSSFDLASIKKRFAMAPTWTAVVSSSDDLMSIHSEPLDALFGGDHPVIDFIANERSKPLRQSNFIVVQSKPKWAHANLEQTNQKICTEICQQLSTALNIDATPILAHRWRFARPADPILSTQKGVYKVADGLWIAGDYLAGGRVEGAYLAGYEAGQRIQKN